MPYMTSIQSVTGGISLSVSQNWSVAVWYFVDNKLTLICLLTNLLGAKFGGMAPLALLTPPVARTTGCIVYTQL